MSAKDSSRRPPSDGRTAGPPNGRKAASARVTSAKPPKRRDREVLEVAARVFSEKGYADASVQDVADELGILKGSVYHYIDSKEDLLYRLLEEVHEDVERILEDVANRENLDSLERLSAYIREQVDYNARNVAKIAIYYNDAQHLGGERRLQIYRRRSAHERFVRKLIEEAQKSGQAEAARDAKALMNCVFGMMIWVYQWYRPGGAIKPDELSRICADFALHGVIGARSASAGPLP
jgi:AcrR family transcriptional regulator